MHSGAEVEGYEESEISDCKERPLLPDGIKNGQKNVGKNRKNKT